MQTQDQDKENNHMPQRFRSSIPALLMLPVLIGALVFAPLAHLQTAAAAPAAAPLSFPVTGTSPGGGTFRGTVTGLSLSRSGTQFALTGTVKGLHTAPSGLTTIVDQAFTGVPTTISDQPPAGTVRPQQERCQILFLDLGPIFLDLLGLELDISPITIDLDAVSGESKLLGNLLCAIVGILDPSTTLDRLVGLINRLLL
jgi:hypothetical protein